MYRVASLRISNCRPAHGPLRAIKRAGEFNMKHGTVRQLMKDGIPVDILLDPDKPRKVAVGDMVRIFSESGADRLGVITLEQAAKALRDGTVIGVPGGSTDVRLTPSGEYLPCVGPERGDVLEVAVSGGLCSGR